jgi:ribonuclease-3
MTNDDIKTIEESIGYVFNDKNLLIDALTHSSYLNEHRGNTVSYERLEFLGDSILDFIVAEELYFVLKKDEGEMTTMRARIVSKTPLAEAVDELGLLSFMRIGRGARQDVVYSVKTKSDLFESVLAAIYIDCGRNMDKPREFVQKHIKRSLSLRDFKSTLQVFVQKNFVGKCPVYKDIEQSESGKPYFCSEVYVNGELKGKGHGLSKKAAEQMAAMNALKAFGIMR